MESNLTNPFAENLEELKRKAAQGNQEHRCLTCDQVLFIELGTIRKYCNKDCRKKRYNRNK